MHIKAPNSDTCYQSRGHDCNTITMRVRLVVTSTTWLRYHVYEFPSCELAWMFYALSRTVWTSSKELTQKSSEIRSALAWSLTSNAQVSYKIRTSSFDRRGLTNRLHPHSANSLNIDTIFRLQYPIHLLSRGGSQTCTELSVPHCLAMITKSINCNQFNIISRWKRCVYNFVRSIGDGDSRRAALVWYDLVLDYATTALYPANSCKNTQSSVTSPNIKEWPSIYARYFINSVDCAW